MKRLFALALAVLLLVFSASASAHAIGVSRGAYTVEGNDVVASLTLARGELVASVPSLDPEHKGTLDPSRLDSERAAIAARVAQGIVVSADGKACQASLTGARALEEDGVAIDARFTCAAPPKSISLTFPWVDELSLGHRHFVLLGASQATGAVLFKGSSTTTFDADQARGNAPVSISSLALLRMGVEHILTGYDHLVFLFGLILVGGRVKSIVAVITAFTLAHSITLAMAGLGVWAPSPKIIEPAIAISIAYVGAENFFVASADKRWRITFPFGLIHGFGFAGALQEIELPRSEIPRALLLFNVGVEAGQLAVLALVLPLVYFLRKQQWFRVSGVRALSVGIIAAGLIWAVMRIAHPGA